MLRRSGRAGVSGGGGLASSRPKTGRRLSRTPAVVTSVLLDEEVRPVERTCRVHFKPWRDALEVEDVRAVAGQAHDEGVLVV